MQATITANTHGLARWAAARSGPAAHAAQHYVDRLTDDDVKAHVQRYADNGVVSKWAVPSRVRTVTTLDKTSVGKLDKKLMRQKYGQ